ncbi:alpha/beta hydrolase [Elizabethkingia meningoseptica]|uniref:alpha/beta hydrolase n=1 Tax=Elizabethkingia meningoseptica TaxID=238 RepID=UPI000841BDB0|nr:alpha/beta fold hydrolase [Elizabethkingia meningoseptica]ODM55000.1 alpha/beta hydrolase [Elizabethkingia meningoseptica]OHT30206.1 alpha/beta hydrolase [Elizabethkingia meningoseptica]OPC11879.1 alpha/beta hydrolase [Elizabethkingia meningoseptica]
MKIKLTLFSLMMSHLFFSQNIEKTASEFVDHLFTKKYEECVKLEDEEVKDKMPEGVLEMVNNQLSGMFGDYKKIISTKKSTGEATPTVLVYTEFSNQKVIFKIPFSKNNKVLGIFKGPDEEVSVAVSRPQTPQPPFSYKTEDVKFKNETEGNLLAGTISIPSDKKDFPIAVMITGSGAQDRDEEIMGHKPFAVIANYLAKNGIGTLRLDDRGVGESEKGKDGATSADFATDINSAVNFLAKRGYTNIGLIGHSEGGMIAPMVANMNKNVKFQVLLAGPGVTGEQILLQQTYDISKAAGSDEATLKANRGISEKIFNYANQYKGNDLYADLKNYIITTLASEPSFKDDPKKLEALAESNAKSFTNPWLAYFIKHDPAKVLEKTKTPILALNGSLDLQVNPQQNLSAIKNALKKAGNKDFEVAEVPMLNHLFQTAQTGSPKEYGEIEETFAPKVMEMMKNWILKHQK